MDQETKLRAALEDWGVDLSDTGKTLWTNIHDNDGYQSMFAFEDTGDRERPELSRHPTIRVYRAFPLGDGVAVSVDVEISAVTFATSDRSELPYDSGERGDFEEWREAIKAELGGDFVFVWANEDEPLFSFVGRTVKVGGAERVVCGQCERTAQGIKVEVDFDRPMDEALVRPAPARGRAFA